MRWLGLAVLGLFLAVVFANVFAVFASLLTGFALGIGEGIVIWIQNILCFTAGAICAFLVVRPMWRQPKQ